MLCLTTGGDMQWLMPGAYNDPVRYAHVKIWRDRRPIVRGVLVRASWPCRGTLYAGNRI